MARGQLRIYHGPQDEVTSSASDRRDTMTLSLAEIAPLLADAVHDRRTWLRDFRHDDVTISSDLYEVLMAYQHFRRPGA
ncbi:MAG: hypothetical protein KDA42_03950 [Planctomycetales bacterium]|nr:hypothetical protein [Planctomycetales bacterium]